MIDFPSSIAAATFDRLLVRGDIIHFRCRFHDGRGVPDRKKFAVVLNSAWPDDPVLFALTTSKTDKYQHGRYDQDIIRIAAGTYRCLLVDTVLSFREIYEEDLDFLRKQYAAKELTRVGKLLKVHMDEANRIIAASVIVERWKKNRCRPT